MKKLLIAAAGVGLAALLAPQAKAVPIAAGSLLSLNGTDSYTATSVTFVNPANIGFGTGSFAGLSCTGCATFNSFTTGTPTPFLLYSATEGAISTSLTATAKPTVTFTAGTPTTLPSLEVTGPATLTLSGFDPTPGLYTLTTQGPTGVEVTFSVTSTASPVPEPASLALLGMGVLGIGVVARRRLR